MNISMQIWGICAELMKWAEVLLAGPVVAGAVILPKDSQILYLNDSKKLTAAKREELYDVIMERSCGSGDRDGSP